MTTSVLNTEELKKLLGEASETAALSSREVPKPVSLNELIERFSGVLTPDQADAMERAIEEGCERIDD